MSDQVTKRTQKPRDVNYTLEIVDDLPEAEIQRRSPLEDQLDKIVDTPAAHGKWVRIASYANGSAASAAANVLRKRHGDKEAVEGWTVRTKRADEDGEVRTGLFVRFNPEGVVAGAREDFDQRMQERRAKLEAKKAEGNGQTPREQKQGPGHTSGTAEAATSKAPAGKR